MFNLKEKVFSFGVFGAPCTELREDEIFVLLRKKWVEFITIKQIMELRSTFTTLRLKSRRDEILHSFLEEQKKIDKSVFGDDEFYKSMDDITNMYNFNLSNSLGESESDSEYQTEYDDDADSDVYKAKNIVISQLSYNEKVLIRTLSENMYVRMNTVAWKEYLTNGSFNFISHEYYYVFDMLIRANQFVSVTDVRTTLKICPKRMFYIIKKLASLGYIEKIASGNKVMVRIKRDEFGRIMKGKIKEKRRSINAEDVYGHSMENTVLPDDHIGKDILIGVPLITQLKNFINRNARGVCSRDIHERFGIKLKIGLKLLNKIADSMKGSIKIVEEFEGKIKRTKFYNVNALNKLMDMKRQHMLEQGQLNLEEGISMEDRIFVIEQLLEKRKAFVLDKEVFQSFKTVFGTKYTLDRRTIINAAIKGGFNVYRLHDENQGPKFVIADKDVQRDDPLISRCANIRKPELNLTSFQLQIYKCFVSYYKFNEIDNGFEPALQKRLNLFYLFLNNIEKDDFYFDFNILDEMSVGLFMKLVSFKRFKFLEDLNSAFKMRLNEKHQTNRDVNWYMNQEHATSIPVCSNNSANFEYTDDNIFCDKDQMYYNFKNAADNLFDLENRTNYMCQDRMTPRGFDCTARPPSIFFDLRPDNVLNLTMKELLNMELGGEYMKIIRMRYEIKTFLPYLVMLQDWNVVHFEYIDNILIKVKKKPVSMEFLKYINREVEMVYHVSASEREKFFGKCKTINERTFYNECLFMINRNYSPEVAKVLISRLNVFKKQCLSAYELGVCEGSFLPNSLYGTYVEIKKSLVSKTGVDPKKYRYTDLKVIFAFMRHKKIINEYKDTFADIELSHMFKRKLDLKIDNILYPDMSNMVTENDEMFSYYKVYLNYLYFTLIKVGSLDIERFSEAVGILEPFEILEFLDYFNTLFKKEIINNKIIVSISDSENVFIKFL